jgi:hypothetical protein
MYEALDILCGLNATVFWFDVTFLHLSSSRDLRCLRNTIHTNLMSTYMLADLFWILTLTLQVSPGITTYLESEEYEMNIK